MLILTIGLGIFFAVHLVPSLSLKTSLIDRYGLNTYKGIFSLFSATGLLLIIYGKSVAPFVPVWNPPLWTRWLPLVMMVPAFILLAAAYLPTNIKTITRHPMLLAVCLFSLSHLGANGDLASLLLFASFLLFAVFDIISVNTRGSSTSNSRRTAMADYAAVAIGIVAYAALLFSHQYIAGIALI